VINHPFSFNIRINVCLLLFWFTIYKKIESRYFPRFALLFWSIDEKNKNKLNSRTLDDI